MQAGSRKGWSSQKSDSSAVTATLVQANAAFNRGLYYQSEDTLYVCQYRDSQVTFSIKDTPVTLLQKQDPLTGSSHLASTSSEKHVRTGGHPQVSFPAGLSGSLSEN